MNDKKLRMLPNSQDAEKNIIGSMMLSKSACELAESQLKPEMIYNENHKLIYETMLKIFSKGELPTLLALAEKMHMDDTLERVGGTLYLSDINSYVPTAANADYFIKILIELWLKRELVRIGEETARDSYDKTKDVFDIYETIEKEITNLSFKNTGSIITPAKLTTDWYNNQEKIKAGFQMGVPSFIKKLDEKILSFANQDLVILAGRPSMGKTAAALSMAEMQVQNGYKVALLSIEMSGISIMNRRVAMRNNINLFDLREGKYGMDVDAMILEDLNKLSELPYFVDDSASLRLNDAKSKIRMMKRKHKIDIVYIDYLQKMTLPGKDSKNNEIGFITGQLKALAKELDIPIVLLAQLNRSVEQTSDKKPNMSHLRDSGEIEQDADLVLFLYRPEYYGIMEFEDNTSTENKGEIIISKQRNGATGSVQVGFIKEIAKYTNDYNDLTF